MEILKIYVSDWGDIKGWGRDVTYMVEKELFYNVYLTL